MHMRRAHESEAPVLSAIAFESKAYWPYSGVQLVAWRDALTISPSTVSSFPTYVAEVEARVAGFFVLVPSSLHWKLEHFWVSPSSLGHGVGRALLSHASRLAAEGGATALTIDTNPNAERFYLACGAQRVGSLAAPIEGSPGRERPQLVLATKRPNLSVK
jgi:GNAT superfamily N-acetyltransferase